MDKICNVEKGRMRKMSRLDLAKRPSDGRKVWRTFLENFIGHSLRSVRDVVIYTNIYSDRIEKLLIERFVIRNSVGILIKKMKVSHDMCNEVTLHLDQNGKVCKYEITQRKHCINVVFSASGPWTEENLSVCERCNT